MSNILELKNINKYFRSSQGENHALKDISINFKNGKITALIGESGSGKTTLGRIIMGLYKSDSGKVFLKGKMINPPKNTIKIRRKTYNEMQMIFQNPSTSLNSQKNVYTILKESIVSKRYHKSMDLKIKEMNGLYSKKEANEIYENVIEIINKFNKSKNTISLIKALKKVNKEFDDHLNTLIWSDELIIDWNEEKEKALQLVLLENKNIKYKMSDLVEDKEYKKLAERVKFNKGVVKTIKDEQKSFNVWKFLEEVEKYKSIPEPIDFLVKQVKGDNIENNPSIYSRNELYLLIKDLIKVIKNDDLFETLRHELNVVSIFLASIGFNNLKQSKRLSKETLINQLIFSAMVNVGLDTSLVYKYPSDFSGGMKQRVSIARAIITKQKLIIADEPTASLDVSIQATILNLLKELNKKFGISIILIAHDLLMVEFIADEIAVMHNGRIVEKGKTEDIFKKPKNEYTKHLLNSIPKIRTEKK